MTEAETELVRLQIDIYELINCEYFFSYFKLLLILTRNGLIIIAFGSVKKRF